MAPQQGGAQGAGRGGQHRRQHRALPSVRALADANYDKKGRGAGDATPFPKLHVGKSWTDPPFYFAYTDPKDDVDVSSQFFNDRAVETGISKVWSKLLQRCCPNNGLVVDVGGNFGWYSLLSAAHGCRVVSWEPVPTFRAFFELAVEMNGFQDRIAIRDRVASNEANGTAKMVVPNKGIWGTASVEGGNIDQAITNDGPLQEIKVRTERVDDVVDEEVCIMKVDVEGFEPYVFEGASKLISSGKVSNVLIEYSPGVWERQKKWDEMHKLPAMLEAFMDAGMEVRNIEDRYTRGGIQRSSPQEWKAALRPKMEKVTRETLKADHENAERMKNGKMNRIPEDLHPNSLHAALGHNTNLWASKDPQAWAGQGGWKDDGRVVGVGSKSDYGLGGRPKNLPTTYVPGDKNRAHPDGFGKGPYDKDILDGKLKPVD